MTADLSYPRIRRAIAETPWAIVPEKLADIMAVVAIRAAGGELTDEEIQQRIGAAVRRQQPAPRATDIALLPLLGTISHRMGMMPRSSGGTSVEEFRGMFRAAVADPQVSAIVIDVDSPGGTVSGVDELAAEIYRARGTKPITAVANTLMASAAYWIASAADEIVITPSGEAGSIGVIAAHEDQSAWYERMGVKVSLITAGRFKAENNPFEPLTDEGRAAIQARVDESYGHFTRAIARHRGVSVETVRGEFGEGRMYGAREAVRRGMADRVATLDAVLADAGVRQVDRPQQAAQIHTLTFEDQAREALTAAQALQSRVEALTALRVGRPSPVAADNVPLITAHRDAYLAIARAYDELLASVPGATTLPHEAASGVLLDFLAVEARRNGVSV